MEDFWEDDIQKKKADHTLDQKYKKIKSRSDLQSLSIQKKKVQHVRHPYIIGFNNIYRVIWDIYIIILAIQNCTLIPTEIAFSTHFETSVGYMFLDWFVDVMFLLDIFFNFRTTMVKNGVEIDDPR